MNSILKRTRRDSYFKLVHVGSAVAEEIFSTYPRVKFESHLQQSYQIVVLQVMNLNNGYLLIEYVEEKDFNDISVSKIYKDN